MTFHKTFFTALSGAVLTIAPSFAQDVQVSPPVTSPRVAPAQTLMLSDLMNWNIMLQNGESVGQITDFVLGPQGDVLFAIGTLNGQSFVLPYSAMAIDPKTQAVHIGLTPTQFDQMSFFRGRNFPDFNATPFRREMTQVFGSRAFNSGTSPRGRGNLGANQTEGRDILNPAGKAPPGLNRDENRETTTPRTNGVTDPTQGTIGGKKEIGDLPRSDLPRTDKTSPNGKTPADTNPNRTPSGTNRIPPTSPRNNPALPGTPSGTPNNPIPKPGITPPVLPPDTPAVPKK